MPSGIAQRGGGGSSDCRVPLLRINYLSPKSRPDAPTFRCGEEGRGGTILTHLNSGAFKSQKA